MHCELVELYFLNTWFEQLLAILLHEIPGNAKNQGIKLILICSFIFQFQQEGIDMQIVMLYFILFWLYIAVP